MSVILFTGGVSGEPPRTRQTPLPPGPGRHPPPPRDQGEPPRTRQGEPTPPPDQADPPGPRRHPPRTRQTPPPGRRLQHTVNERPVRILLECILVKFAFTIVSQYQFKPFYATPYMAYLRLQLYQFLHSVAVFLCT